MTNSAGRPVFQQNAFRRAGGHLYRPAGHLIIEIGPVIQNLGGMILAGGSKNYMAGPQARLLDLVENFPIFYIVMPL